MIQKFQETGKFIGGNAFWRPAHPGNNGFFHIGDHVFMCETEILLSAYGMMLRAFENFEVQKRILDNGATFQ